MAVPIPVDSVHAWLDKLVRGMLFFRSGHFVEQSHEIKYLPFLTPEALSAVAKQFDGKGDLYANGPGVAIRMGVAEDGVSSVFVIRLWEQIYMGAAVGPRGIDTARD